MNFISKNWFSIFVLAIVVFTYVKSCNDNPRLKEKIDKLEKANDIIKQSIANKNFQIDILNDSLSVNKRVIDSISKEKQKVSIIRIKADEQINNFNDSELDSVINSIPKKEVVKRIIDHPLVVDELNLANKLIVSYKKHVVDLEKRDSLRVLVIKDMNNIISNVEEQRDLYKKAARPKTNGFVYLEVPANNFDRFEGGIDVVVKNKLLMGISGDYINTSKNVGVNVKLGLKIF